ncbi:MAG: hydrogenase 3 maturation endopeptidase HyCI [Candidatus Bipolaricaulota bacterium]
MKRLLLGVGNRLGGDDGIGPALAAQLSGAAGWQTVDCGVAVENACGIVAREAPDLLVVVDAARMGLSPGAVRRVPIEATERLLVSTHALPLSFLWPRLTGGARRTVFLGVEPATLALGEGLSPDVASALEVLERALRAGDLETIPVLSPSCFNPSRTELPG